MKTDEVKEYLKVQKKDAIKLVDEINEDKISVVIEEIEKVARQGGEVYTIGNGGSASTAKHLAADLDKTADQDVEFNIKSSSLVSNESLLTAWTNDADWDEVYKGQLEGRITSDDMLMAISVHGGTSEWSGNLVKAIEYANSKGAATVGLAGFDGGEFTEVCDQSFVVRKESTPLAESIHVLIHHMIVFGLRESGS